jgi:hypothetical protein
MDENEAARLLYEEKILNDWESGLADARDDGIEYGIGIGEQRGISIGEQRGISIGEGHILDLWRSGVSYEDALKQVGHQ